MITRIKTLICVIALSASVVQAQEKCDRACVSSIIDNYVAAVLNHDPSRLPLSENYRLTENGEIKKVGEGVWQSISQQNSYSQTFIDQDNQDAVFFGSFQEGDQPILLAIRFKLDGNKISEVENLVSRYDDRNRLILRSQLDKANPIYEAVAPKDKQLSKDQLIAAGHAYFDGIANSTDQGVPMHAECVRRENGVTLLQNKNPKTEPCPIGFHRFNYITVIRDRRVAVVDQERNLILMWAVFDIPGNIEVAPGRWGPSDIPSPEGKPRVDTRRIPRSLYIAELFRLEDGLIRDIDAIMFNEDLGFKAGWE